MQDMRGTACMRKMLTRLAGQRQASSRVLQWLQMRSACLLDAQQCCKPGCQLRSHQTGRPEADERPGAAVVGSAGAQSVQPARSAAGLPLPSPAKANAGIQDSNFKMQMVGIMGQPAGAAAAGSAGGQNVQPARSAGNSPLPLPA